METTSGKTGFRRRTALRFAAAAVVPFAAWGQSWPARSVRLVVPFPPGGSVDIAARPYAKGLSAILGQPVVIDNRAGASGNIGAEFVARAAPDGYTLLFGNDFLVTNPSISTLRYNTVKDFVGIANIATTGLGIACTSQLPVQNMQQLIALSKGRELNYASTGVGTSPHLLGLLLSLQTGAKLKAIQYRGSAPATADAVAGHVDLSITSLAPMVPHLKTGKLRGLAVTSAKRSAQAPDVPTLRETGIDIRPYEVFYGTLAPAGTPAAIVDRLVQASRTVMQDAEIVKTLLAAGFDVEPKFGTEFSEDIRLDLERWVRVADQAKLPKE